MAAVILPDLDIEMHSRLRSAWTDALQSGERIPSLRSAEPTFVEAVMLEGDYLRRVRANPGPEVERRLGVAPTPQRGALTIGNARLASQDRSYTSGLRAVLRLVTLGRSLGASDLVELISGGPSNALFRSSFDDASVTLIQAQRDLGVRWGERIRDDVLKATPAIGRFDVPTLGDTSGRSLGREFG